MSADEEKQESQMNEGTENAQASESTPAQLPPPLLFTCCIRIDHGM
jgi:hypothetical protein